MMKYIFNINQLENLQFSENKNKLIVKKLNLQQNHN